MEVAALVREANYAYIAKEILEMELRLISEPALKKDKNFSLLHAEKYGLLRKHSSKIFKTFVDKVDVAPVESLMTMKLQFMERWQTAISKLCISVCHEMPSTRREIEIVLNHLGLQHGNWFDFLNCIAKVNQDFKLVDAPYYTVQYGPITYYVSPNPGWVVHTHEFANGKKWELSDIKFEYTEPLENHARLTEEEVKKWQ